MQLLLLRHGPAADAEPDQADEARPLTDQGIRKTRRAVEGLRRILPAPDVILTSPRLRAKQTAELAAKALGGPSVEIADELGHGDLEAIVGLLSQRGEKIVLIVGHEPTFSQLIEALCTSRSGGELRGFIKLKRAGAAHVEVDWSRPGDAATLRWLATPKMLRRLRR